jgi:hypothetical protein
MAVQAVVDENLGAVLQGLDVGRLVGQHVVELDFFFGERRGGVAGGERQQESQEQFFHVVFSPYIVTRSGTGLNWPMRLHHGMPRKNPKYSTMQICETIWPVGDGGRVPR